MDLSVLNKALDIKSGLVKSQPSSIVPDGERVIEIEIEKIKADPNQPRKEFNAQDIQELADDIRQNGLIQPIIVRKDGVGDFIVVAGERRLRAYQVLKEPKIKAIIRDYSADQLGYIQIAENIKRADLKYYELAEFIINKIDKGEKQSTVADKLGMSKTEVSRYMSWRDAPEFLKDVKEKLSSIRAFYDLVKLSVEDSAKVEEFVKNSGDRITAAEVGAFKKSLKEPEFEETKTKTEDVNAVTAVDVKTESFETENESQDVIETGASAENADSEVHENDGIVESNNESGSQSAAASELDSDGDVSKDSEELAADAGSEVKFADSDSSGESFEPEESAINQESSDSEINTDFLEESEAEESGEEKFRKPLIIGSVEGREAYLLFKLRPVTDGMVKVKYEDGFIEEVLAEKFRINRIAEE